MNKDSKIGNNLGEVLLNLSRREGEILVLLAQVLLAQGKKNKEIADELHISKRTVENHRYRVCKKLGLEGRGALKKWIIKNSNSINHT